MIFISYSQKDEIYYSGVCSALKNANFSYWTTDSMKAGTSLRDQLREAITRCDICIFIVSPNSIRSEWCLAETGAFWGAGKRTILYKTMPDIEPPSLFHGDVWTSDLAQLVEQLKGYPDLSENELFRLAIDRITSGYPFARTSGFEPFVTKSKDALLEYVHLLDGIQQGHMMAEVGGKYSYGKRGTMAAKETLRAVCYEDAEAWRTEHLKDVIRANGDAVRRGVKVQRVFILSGEEAMKAKDVLDEHKETGAEIRIVKPEDLPNTQLLESFFVVDDTVLVVFYFTRDGKRFRDEKISINEIEVDRAISNFDSIYRRAKIYE